jgi:hypothetical protein
VASLPIAPARAVWMQATLKKVQVGARAAPELAGPEALQCD